MARWIPPLLLALVHLGCYYKTTTDWVAQTTFFTLLETEKSKIKMPADSICGGNPLLGLQKTT